MAKRIRRMARDEMSGDKGVIDRRLVRKRSGPVINEPISIRAMTLQMKDAYKAARGGREQR